MQVAPGLGHALPLEDTQRIKMGRGALVTVGIAYVQLNWQVSLVRSPELTCKGSLLHIVVDLVTPWAVVKADLPHTTRVGTIEQLLVEPCTRVARTRRIVESGLL